MKLLGLIGGTSWHSTIEYYRYINLAVNHHFGNNTNPPLLLYNMDQYAVHSLQRVGDWNAIADLILEGATRLQRGGVEGLVLCANTPHRVFDVVTAAVQVPIIHICDATSKAILANNINKVGLIGTRFTMEESFMTDRFQENGVTAIVPNSVDQIIELHRIIQEELTFGKILPASKQFVLQVIDEMTQLGAEGIVLGCTEFPLMLEGGEIDLPTFNTTRLHAEAATEFILDR